MTTRILVTGSTGLLGGYLVAAVEERGDDIVARGGPGRTDGVDLTDEAATLALLARARPDVVIHAAALSTIADCARDPERARRINVEATANVARASRDVGARLVHVSTDLVFDGEHAPYDENATPAPLSVYGRTKLDAEHRALAVPDSVVVRVSLLFGPTRTARRGFFDLQVDALVSAPTSGDRAGEPLRLFDDEWRTPLSLRAAAEGLLAVAHDRVHGILHLGGPERLSRWEMGILLARALGIEKPSIAHASRASVQGDARPRDVSLDSTAFRRSFPGVATESFISECVWMRANAREHPS